MSLVLAFKKNAAAVQQAEATYKQNVIEVNTLMTNISSSSIPTLNTSPPDWDSFVATFGQAKTAALSWASNVLA
jgi:hypothetical protein